MKAPGNESIQRWLLQMTGCPLVRMKSAAMVASQRCCPCVSKRASSAKTAPKNSMGPHDDVTLPFRTIKMTERFEADVEVHVPVGSGLRTFQSKRLRCGSLPS